MTAHYGKRLSISLPSPLRELLESGQLAGDSLPERLATLASRYRVMTDVGLPTLQAKQWAQLVQHARGIDLRHPAAHLTLLAVVRADKSAAQLPYKLEGMQTAVLYGLIGVLERLISAGAGDEAGITAALAGCGIAVEG